MAQPVAEVVPTGQRPQQQQGGMGQSVTGIIRIAVMRHFAMKFFSPKKPFEASQLMLNLLQKDDSLGHRCIGELKKFLLESCCDERTKKKLKPMLEELARDVGLLGFSAVCELPLPVGSTAI